MLVGYISKTVIVRGGYITTDWTTPDPIANPTILDAQGHWFDWQLTSVSEQRLSQSLATAA